MNRVENRKNTKRFSAKEFHLCNYFGHEISAIKRHLFLQNTTELINAPNNRALVGNII